MLQDYLFYGTDTEMRYAFRMCHLSNLVKIAQHKHGLSLQKTKLLADGLLGGILLASLLEDEERINLRIHMGSEFTMASETTRHAQTKGYLEFEPESFLPQALEDGYTFEGELFVRSMRSQAHTGKIFEGVTKTYSSTIEEALNAHLAQSYQLKSRIKMQSWINKNNELISFGAVYLELPNLAQPIKDNLYQHIDSLPSMKSLYENSDDPDVLAKALIPHQVKAINSITPRWSCTCSQESIEKMLKTLAESEKQDLISKNEDVEIKCHYCSTKYIVSLNKLY